MDAADSSSPGPGTPGTETPGHRSPPGPGDRSLLRAARLDRGWSQSEAAHHLADLLARRDGGTARPASLKTQLSRWENGHATPAPEHRELLAELYGRTTTELGLAAPAPEAGATGADRLRASLERAAAIGEQDLVLLEQQLRAVAGLDHRLGTAAAHDVLAAQVRALHELLTHCPDPVLGPRLAGLLARAALLAGDQERDRDEPDLAWRSYALADDAARRAGRAELTQLAGGRRARLHRELVPGSRDPVAADVQHPPVPVSLDPGHDGPSVRDRTEAAWREALAAHRDGRAEDAGAAAARARRLALRSGSARTLALLARLDP